jgi:DNA-binding GntR family transcriptional regulator
VPLKSACGPYTAEEIAVAELRQAIVRGDLPPGAPIRQGPTARELGLSVIPLREALKTLTSEGVITYRPLLGYSVTELDPESLDGVFRVRELLEGAAEQVGARQANGKRIAEMRAAMRAQQNAARSGDAVGVITSNRRFHFVLFQLCDNPLLLRYVRQTWDALDPHRAVAYRCAFGAGDASRADRVHDEHRRIVDALAARDSEGAISMLSEHRRGEREALRTFLRNSVLSRAFVFE